METGDGRGDEEQQAGEMGAPAGFWRRFLGVRAKNHDRKGRKWHGGGEAGHNAGSAMEWQGQGAGGVGTRCEKFTRVSHTDYGWGGLLRCVFVQMPYFPMFCNVIRLCLWLVCVFGLFFLVFLWDGWGIRYPF